MAFSENLYCLRKRHKITQEELADDLGVSRQSVSKWETGEAYPETDKLILLCDKFGVSLDEIVRGDLNRQEGTTQTEAPVQADADEICGHMRKFARAMAVGAFLILLGVAVCVALAGWSMAAPARFAHLLSVLCGVAVLAFVTVAVFIFVYYGIAHENFLKAHPLAEKVYADAQTDGFLKRFTVVTACSVAGILLDVVMLVGLSALIEAKLIGGGDAAYCFVTAGFMAVLSFVVGGLVYMGVRRRGYRENARAFPTNFQ